MAGAMESALPRTRSNRKLTAMPITLEHRSAIHDLVAEFAWRVDHNDGVGVENLFTEDGTYDMAGWVISGREDIKHFYDDRRARGPRTSRHLFTGLRLSANDDAITGISVLTLHAEQGAPPLRLDPVLVADYSDTYVRDEDGRWLFGNRAVTPLFLRDVPDS